MKTIFLVEDNPVVTCVYRAKFVLEGFHVETAEDGLAAIKVLPFLRPDLVVLDLMMPKLNGADVLKFLRADPVLKFTPVIILSDAYMTELGSEAAKAGAELALLKSTCTPAMLVQAVRQIFAGEPLAVEPSKRLAVKSPDRLAFIG
jgi:two-component system, response regulator